MLWFFFSPDSGRFALRNLGMSCTTSWSKTRYNGVNHQVWGQKTSLNGSGFWFPSMRISRFSSFLQAQPEYKKLTSTLLTECSPYIILTWPIWYLLSVGWGRSLLQPQTRVEAVFQSQHTSPPSQAYVTQGEREVWVKLEEKSSTFETGASLT